MHVTSADLPVGAGRRSRTALSRSWLRPALDLVAVALVALFVTVFAVRNVLHQGDLKVYLEAARVARAGDDPYRPASLPFVYPAVALIPFLALASLPAHAALGLWIWAKVALLALLVLGWKRWLRERAGLLELALVAAFGWNQSALWDLGNGNVALLECALLWGAFACYASGRRTAFALLVVAAACFKLMPAAFLLLLLVPTQRDAASPGRLVGAAAVLAAIVLGPLVIGPAAAWGDFWRHVPDATTYGDANPGGLGLAVVAAQRAGLGEAVGARVGGLAWAAFVLALGSVSLGFLRRAWRAGDPSRWIMAAVFLYVLAAPRPMAYGFALLAPAPFFFAPRPFDRPEGRLLLALVLSAQGLSRAAHVQSSALAFLYAPFLLTLCVWLLVLNDEATRRDASIAAP